MPSGNELFELGQKISRLEGLAEFSHDGPDACEVEIRLALYDALDIRLVTRSHRECLHDDHVFGSSQSKGHPLDLTCSSAFDDLSFEWKGAEAHVDLDATRLVAHQQNSGDACELEGVVRAWFEFMSAGSSDQ